MLALLLGLSEVALLLMESGADLFIRCPKVWKGEGEFRGEILFLFFFWHFFYLFVLFIFVYKRVMLFRLPRRSVIKFITEFLSDMKKKESFKLKILFRSIKKKKNFPNFSHLIS